MTLNTILAITVLGLGFTLFLPAMLFIAGYVVPAIMNTVSKLFKFVINKL